MRWIVRRLRNSTAREDGVGMILVVGTTFMITSLIATALVVTMNTLAQTRNRVDFEQALAAAEQGIDQTMARLQWAFDYYGSDYPVPGPVTAEIDSPDCTGETVAQPASFDSTDEETWARAQLQTILTDHPECVQSGPSGEYLVLKPANPLDDPEYGTVYAIGWAPSRTAANNVERFIKAEYVFLPYQPGFAILAGGNLEISGSTYVSTVSGYDPALAAVHSNGTITTANGNPTVTGVVSSTETSTANSNNFSANSGGSVTQQPEVYIPTVSALTYYRQANHSSVDWYDVCVTDAGEGEIRRHSGGDTPCTGTVYGDGDSIGWTYDSDERLWAIGRNSVTGAFFVHEADVTNGVGNANFANMTVIASAQNADDCATKTYGNIIWDHYDLQAPTMPNLFLMADTDIWTHSNFTAGSNGNPVVSGMFIAGDQMHLQTSSQGAVGSVLAADQCDQTDSLVSLTTVQNPAVYYDPTGDSPFTSIIRTTLWLEY